MNDPLFVRYMRAYMDLDVTRSWPRYRALI
jgi:hypothetical protein